MTSVAGAKNRFPLCLRTESRPREVEHGHSSAAKSVESALLQTATRPRLQSSLQITDHMSRGHEPLSVTVRNSKSERLFECHDEFDTVKPHSASG